MIDPAVANIDTSMFLFAAAFSIFVTNNEVDIPPAHASMIVFDISLPLLCMRFHYTIKKDPEINRLLGLTNLLLIQFTNLSLNLFITSKFIISSITAINYTISSQVNQTVSNCLNELVIM